MGYFILIIVIRAESSDLHVINSSLMIVRVYRNTQVSIYRYSVQIMPTEKKHSWILLQNLWDLLLSFCCYIFFFLFFPTDTFPAICMGEKM